MFGALSNDEILSIFNGTKYSIKTYENKQIVHIQNDVCECIDVILEGCIVVKKVDLNGRMLTVGEFRAKEIIGANLIFSTKNTYPMMVMANCTTKILHIHKDVIMKLCKNNSDFMMSLLRSVSDKVSILTEKIDQISMKSIREKIVEYLEYESYLQETNVIKLGITKTKLAEKFGIPRSSLSRELNKMRSDGMINFDARTITIIKID